MSLKRPFPSSSLLPPSNAPPQTISSPPPHTIYTTSAPIHDRKSTFTAFYSPTFPSRSLQTYLRSLPQTSNADHYILAWRTPKPAAATLEGHFAPAQQNLCVSGQFKVFETGSDDDGEKYGGKEVLKVLEMERVQGACAVVRWYGGVMLGPVRFRHMENVARAAVREGKKAQGMSLDDGAGVGKRVKIDEGMDGEGEEEMKRRRVEDLQERDGNIEVLRGLLRDVKGRVERRERLLREEAGGEAGTEKEEEGDKQASQSEHPASPAKKTDYAAMSLEALKKMDKAKDSTVAFLLKKIEEAEEAEKRLLQNDDKQGESSSKDGNVKTGKPMDGNTTDTANEVPGNPD